MALIVKYKFQNVDANGNSVSLLPQFPSGVSYTKTDVVEGNITTRTVETDDLSKVTYIRFGCNSDTYVTGAWEYLTEILDINTSNVTIMNNMFHGCSQLTQLDVSNWDTSSVQYMGSMFNKCSQLTQLDVSNWVTSNVTIMNNMFNGCSQLTQLDVSNWDTSSVQYMSSMFYSCSKLTQLDISNWDTSKVTTINDMFNGCSQLTQLDVSNFNTSKVTSINGMFSNCQSLTLLDLSNFDTSNVTNMANMFQNCKVKNIGLIYCSEDTIDNLANCITSPCNFYVINKNYTSPNPLVKYVIYKQDKKPLLYYNPTTETWEKPVLKEWDSIEKHSDGKYYYHKRSGEVVLDGSENWRIRPDVTDVGVNVIFSVFTSFKYNKSSYMICDKFNPKSVGGANDAYSKGEGIAYYNYSGGSEYAIYYVISKSKLTSQDTQGFAQWLQANPFTLVYQLETEEVYECTSIDLITYENETNYIVTAGAIAPVSTLKVMCNINNVVRELQQKVSNLENYIQHVMIDALNNALNE